LIGPDTIHHKESIKDRKPRECKRKSWYQGYARCMADWIF